MAHSGQGIIRDKRGEEQPADKQRAQTVHKTEPGHSVSGEATRDPKLRLGHGTRRQRRPADGIEGQHKTPAIPINAGGRQIPVSPLVQKLEHFVMRSPTDQATLGLTHKTVPTSGPEPSHQMLPT
jgi:hypothetical protein